MEGPKVLSCEAIGPVLGLSEQNVHYSSIFEVSEENQSIRESNTF